MFDETLLHWETLTKMVNDFKPQGTPLLEMGLFSKNQVQGQQYIVDIVKINRTKSHAVGKRAASVATGPEVIKRMPVTLARSFDHVKLDGATLLNLRNPGSQQLQRIASDQVGREVKKLGRRIDYRNEFYMASAIQGSITDTIDGVSFTADFAFPATHKLTVGGDEMLDGLTLMTSWSDPDADINADITRIRQQVRQDSGFELETIIVGPEIMAAVINNNMVKSYFRGTQEGMAFVKNGFRGQLFGLNWVEYGASYKDDSDVVTRFLPAGTACFIPGTDPLVAELIEGEDVIPSPNKMDIQSIIGRYSYASINDDPAGIKLFVGEVSFPVIYVPGAFAKAVVL
jgi:hypothetical protein